MNLKELKSMIAEEYTNFMAEQDMDPGIEVGPNDVDAMGGGNSEATLRQIYDMLKSYFEGEAGAGAEMPMAAPAGGENMGDMDAAAMGDDDEIGMEDPGMDDDDADADDDDDAEALQERFKKLANIIKG